MRLRDIVLDGSTAALIAAARATQASEGLPAASATSLVCAARACRLYVEAGLPRLASAQLDVIEKLMAGCEDELLVDAYAGLITRARSALKITTKESLK